MSWSILIEGVGKKYRRGEIRYLSNSFRESLTRVAKSTISRLNPFSHLRPSIPVLSSDSSEFWALQDIHLQIQQGDVVGVIGRNGVGKSTLLRILARIIPPTCGTVRYRGRMAALLEVGTGFHRELSGRENIYLNGSILGMRRLEITHKLDEIVAFAGIGEFLDTPVKFYSSGMYVRLAFAVAAHLDPDILVVDEVLAVGDAAFQKKCLGKMEEVARGGRTILFVSHSMFAVSSLCKSSIWLEKGRIAARGPVREVIEKYEGSLDRRQEDVPHAADRHPEDLAEGAFRIGRVRMFNLAGKESTRFQYNEKLVLIVDLLNVLGGGSFSLEFMLYDEHGHRISTGASGPYHDKYFEKPVKRIKIEIGPLNLTCGTYRFSFSAICGQDRLDIWENAIAFTITRCRPFGTHWEILARGEGACVIGQKFSEIKGEKAEKEDGGA